MQQMRKMYVSIFRYGFLPFPVARNVMASGLTGAAEVIFNYNLYKSLPTERSQCVEYKGKVIKVYGELGIVYNDHFFLKTNRILSVDSIEEC